MPESQTRLSGIFTLLAPYFERQKQKEREELAGMITKVLSGNATPEETSMLLANNPEALTTALATRQTQNKLQQEQWQLGEQRRLMGMLQPQQQQATMPTQQDITQAFSARQGGRFSNIPFPTPQPARTVYPSDEKIRNIAVMIEALGGNGLNMGKLLTERSQAGYYDAGAAERASRIGINQARQGLLGEQAGLVKLQQQTEMAKPGEIQARIRKIMQDTVNGMFKSEADIRAKLAEVEETKQAAMFKAQQIEKLKQDRRLVEAKAVEQELINNDVPAIKQAEISLLNARRQKAEMKSGGATGAVKAAPLTSGQRNQLSKFAQKLEADSRKKGGLWHKDPEIKNREQAEASAREFGLYDTNHPEVKAVLDRYFPQATTTQTQSRTPISKNNDPLGIR